MELSGNLWERVVTLGNATGRNFSGVHGNGTLTSGGASDVSGWPAAAGTGWKGGSWLNTTTNSATTSDRAQAANTDNTRSADAGGRGVRTIPSGIVSDGLVLWLDAGIPSSYPGSGTTWNDISGNGIIGTLTNNPTYTTDFGGSIFFNGSSNYVETNTNNIISGNNPFTVEVFYRLTTTGGYKQLIGNYGNFTDNSVIGVYGDYGVYQFTNFLNAPLSTNIYCLQFTRDYTGNCVLYKNGIVNNTGFQPRFIGSYENFRIGADSGSSPREYFNGNIYNLKVYNRVLSPSEILQNYNAQKARFGL
jgi:hypothetical protein